MAFDNNKLGELRPNQIITTFGPGSIVDAVKDSVTVLDTNYWKEKGTKIIDGRLASYLGVDCFYMPRTSYGGDIPVVSFPYVHVCSKCGRLFDVRENFDLDLYLQKGVNCPDCGWQAYPSRFITVCEDGHMDDFPWRWWVHKGDTNCKGQLRTYSIGNTSTLADMWVECTCGAKRSLSGAMQKDNFEGCSCSGRHPFRPHTKKTKCGKPVIPSQRGASNVYFSVSRSAISIPPWINPLYNLLDEHLRLIMDYKEDWGEEGVTKVYNKYFADRYSREEFDVALEKRLSNIKEFTEIKQMEYDAITHHADPAYESNKKHFKAEEDPLPSPLQKYFKRVVRITRLREVKVLIGFTRVDASDPDADADDQPNIVTISKGKGEKWLPAAVVNGEGIFIEFNRIQSGNGSRVGTVNAISKQYEESYREFCNQKKWTVNILRNAVYVLMHTFSHLLIKQMAMSSGYSSAAIRERIYFGDSMSVFCFTQEVPIKKVLLEALWNLGTLINW
jgi:DNA-directed RNA polymerase subunit RPC12/RpoP